MQSKFSSNKYWQKDIFEVEAHPFEPFIKPNANRLIIGTFPTHEANRKYKFYYSGEDNLFWKIIEQVFDHKFKWHEGEIAVTERQDFLESQRIGMTDMLLKCYRKNMASSDESLYLISLNDIFKILDEYKTIETLVLTSRTKISGALGLLETLSIQKDIKFTQPIKRDDNVLQGSLYYNGKVHRIYVPYSPSPRLIKEGRTTIKELKEMYSLSLK